MKRHLAALAWMLTISASALAQQFELTLDRRAAAESLTLAAPDSIPRPTTLEKATRAIEKQIEEKRAVEANRSPLQPFWEATFWKSPLMKLIPIPLGPQPLAEDLLILPDYLSVSRMQSDYQLRLSDERGRELFRR